MTGHLCLQCLLVNRTEVRDLQKQQANDSHRYRRENYFGHAKNKKENTSCYQSGNVWVTLQSLNFHISRKRISVKLLQPYVTFNQPLSQVRKSLPTSASLGKFA